MGAHAGGHAAVNVPAHRDLLARGLGVHVHERGVGPPAQLGEDRVDLGEGRANRIQEELAGEVDHR